MKITINKALTDLKLLDKKIEKLECSIQCVGLKSNSSEKIEKSLKTVKDFQNSAIADYQKLIDLIARYNKLKNLITISNAITQVKIGKETMTVAEAINKKYTIGYEKNLLETLIRQYSEVKTLYENKMVKTNDRLDKEVVGVFGKEGKTTDTKNIEAFKTAFLNRNGYEIIDPLDIDKKIKEMTEKIDDFESNIDNALSVSNATTYIEIDD